MEMHTKRFRRYSILTVLSLICGFGASISATAALDRAPIPIKEFNVRAETFFLSSTIASGGCFSDSKFLFRDPSGKTVNVALASTKTYTYLTIYLSAIPKDSQCFKGTQVTFNTQARFKVKTAEVRDYTTKRVLWSASQKIENPISPTDSPIENPIQSFVGTRHIFCETCTTFTQDIVLTDINAAGESALTPLSSQSGYMVVGKRSDGLIVKNKSTSLAINFSELWLVTSSGWKLISEEAFQSDDSILLTTDLKSFISPQSMDPSQGNSTLNIYTAKATSGSSLPWKVLFDVKKYGGGFISSLSASPDDQFGYFTHISKGISNVYRINLTTSKVSKVGKTVDGFNLEAIDAEGNLVGIIKKRADADTASKILKISLNSLTEAAVFETVSFKFMPDFGPAVIVSGKYFIFDNDASHQQTLLDSTGVEKPLTFRIFASLDFISSLPYKWSDKGAIPSIPSSR